MICQNISQGSVAIQLRYGGIFNNFVVANFPQTLPVKEFLKSVDFLGKIWTKDGGMFFDSQCCYLCPLAFGIVVSMSRVRIV